MHIRKIKINIMEIKGDSNYVSTKKVLFIMRRMPTRQSTRSEKNKNKRKCHKAILKINYTASCVCAPEKNTKLYEIAGVLTEFPIIYQYHFRLLKRISIFRNKMQGAKSFSCIFLLLYLLK